MTSPSNDPAPLAAVKGRAAYDHALAEFRNGTALATLSNVRTVQVGLAALVGDAVALARRQGSSWADIGAALDITRQSAQARFGATDAGLTRPPAGTVPPAELVEDVHLDVPDYPEAPKSQRYPVQVWRLADGDLVAVVSDVWGNTSLMNASERIMRTVQGRWPGSHLLERWTADSAHGAPDDGENYAWSTGNGGNVPADLDDLGRRGLDLR